VSVVIRGARRAMPSGAIIPRAGRIDVEILEPLLPSDSRQAADELRHEARRRILARLDEPDLEAASCLARPADR
jgi:1-acyl-sn-glycerol-3-phosphate acyltransferase